MGALQLVALALIAIAATASLKISSLTDLVTLARSQPGGLYWATGPGLPQCVFAAFEESAGLGMASVSYRKVVVPLASTRVIDVIPCRAEWAMTGARFGTGISAGPAGGRDDDGT
jgi:hypothetical protein